MPYADRNQKRDSNARYWRKNRELINQRRRSAGEKQEIQKERERVRSMGKRALAAEVERRTIRNMALKMEPGRARLAAISEVRCLGANIRDTVQL